MLTFSMFINFGWEMFIETSRMLFGHKSVLAVGLSGCIQSLRWELRKKTTKSRKVKKSKSQKVRKVRKVKKLQQNLKSQKVEKFEKFEKSEKSQIFRFQDNSWTINVCFVECSWIYFDILRQQCLFVLLHEKQSIESTHWLFCRFLFEQWLFDLWGETWFFDFCPKSDFMFFLKSEFWLSAGPVTIFFWS